MSEAGAHLSSLLGGKTEVSEHHSGDTKVYTSPTTNSYTKCIEALAGNFKPEEIKLALGMIEKHDRNSFTEEKEIGAVYEETNGVRTKTQTKTLFVKGTYKYAVLAHLKTIEMWIAYKKV
ncbi:MAG: hypothetical protein KGL39_40755 [Patescibacteria group bacterium]|nr:hypothetical protein [Patescibacteria group bacterium]